MSDIPIIYSDDTDAVIERWKVTDRTGQDLAGSPVVALDGDDYTIAATWIDLIGSSRTLRVPIDATTLGTGVHTAYLRVVGGSDIVLGQFMIAARR